MARAITATHDQLALEVEIDPDGAPGEYVKLCGLTDVSISRNSNVDTSEIPDCADESLPLSIERAIRSQEVTVSASGVWALQSHQTMLDWWYSGRPLPARLRNAKVEADGDAGDTVMETGPAILTSISNDRAYGKKVTASVSIEFDGVPERTAKA